MLEKGSEEISASPEYQFLLDELFLFSEQHQFPVYMNII